MRREPSRTMTSLRGLPFVLAAVATALVLGLGARWGTAIAPSGAALAACAAFLPYAALLVLTPPRRRIGIGLAVLLALAAGLALCRSPALLSDDLYRHMWDGKLVVHRVDPYAHAPEAPALIDLRDAYYPRINHRDVPTIYPPLAQLVFAAGYRLHPSPLGQRLIALGLHLACALLVFGSLQRGGAAATGKARAVRAATLLALNPLALLECALHGHFDIAVGALVVAFVWALPRPALAAAALGAVSALKLVGAALLPLLWQRSRRACLAAAALTLLCVVPLWHAGVASNAAGSGVASDAAASGLRHYASRWQGNAALFGVLETVSAAGVNGFGRLSSPAPDVRDDELRLNWARGLLAALADTPLDPHPIPLVEHKAPRPVDVLPRRHLAGLLARLLALALFATLVVKLLRSHLPAAEVARLTLFGVLLLAPQLHPWYLLWLLPLELALGRRAGLLWSALALSAYASIDHWVGSRYWIETPGSAPLQSAVVLCALWFEARMARADAHVDRPGGADYALPPRSQTGSHGV